jgi:hypothetical protein
MAAFLYRCPNTGRQVQSWLADDPTDCPDGDNADTYQSLACLACIKSLRQAAVLKATITPLTMLVTA